MAYLPEGMAEEIAKAETWVKRDDLRDGIYVFGHMRTSYEKTKKGPALIIEHKIISAKKIKEDIEPNPVGSVVSYFMADYGDAAVMLKPNFKNYICGLRGLDPKKVDDKNPEFVKTIKLIGGERQLAMGMLIEGTTYHTITKGKGEDFTGVNWTPVPGENDPSAPSVIARRAEYAAFIATMPAAGSEPVAPGAPAIPGAAPAIPGAAPAIPGGDPLVAAAAKGWQVYKDNPAWWWNPSLPNGQNLKSTADIQAGKF